MIFVYLLGIAVSGTGVLLFLEHKKTKSNLLQIIKRSCNIDSVRFEKRLSNAQTKSINLKKYVSALTHISLKKALDYSQLPVNKLKYFIRMKLHSDTYKEKPSSFITKIKEKPTL
ncbi:MAG: hypothetical protein ACI870_000049 [Crocinitomicaceae bacterium]|jgi:hypothetical protein